jgi:hypothetical protein
VSRVLRDREKEEFVSFVARLGFSRSSVLLLRVKTTREGRRENAAKKRKEESKKKKSFEEEKEENARVFE